MTSQLESTWLDAALDRIRPVRVAVFGDFCLDAYWLIEADESELSLETGLPLRRVRQQRYSLGGAGNVVANLVALGIAEVHAIGLVGSDLFGWQILKLLKDSHVNVEGMICGQNDWQTLVYSKPCIRDRELNRLDFGSFGVPSSASIEALTAHLDRVADGQGAQEVPGIKIIEQMDPVGAGDTTIAALAAVLAAGGDVSTSARLANIAAPITVRKRQTTGTATPEQICSAGPDLDYVYLPKLAADPRRARLLDGSEIEIVRPLPASRHKDPSCDLRP